MKKSIIYIALLFAVFGCKDEEIQEPTLLSLIPGRYSFRWYETEPGTNHAIDKADTGGFVEFSIDANNLITLRGRSAGNRDFIESLKFSYKEESSLNYDLYQKNDIRRSGVFWYDKSDKTIIKVGFSVFFADSLGRYYQIGGEKLGR
jgi:hypothetical protein